MHPSLKRGTIHTSSCAVHDTAASATRPKAMKLAFLALHFRLQDGMVEVSGQQHLPVKQAGHGRVQANVRLSERFRNCTPRQAHLILSKAPR